MKTSSFSNLICVLALAGTAVLPVSATAASTAPSAKAAVAPADQFLADLAHYCGQAFAGRIIANQPQSSAPDPFDGKTLVMHVRGCDSPQQELRVPFHVGDDHSRTWVISRTGSGLRLKHDHRHADGSPDAVTMYGGDTAQAGSAGRQEFPVDAESVAMFTANGMTASLRNTWAMELVPGKRFVYELVRPDGRLFQVEFDLSVPVALPPAPWGSEA